MVKFFKRSRLPVAWLGCLLVPLPLLAQTPTMPVPRSGMVPLSAEQLVQWIAVSNLSAVSARLQTNSSQQLMQAEQALYDPIFRAKARVDDNKRPRSTDEYVVLDQLSGKQTENLENSRSVENGFTFKMPTGAQLEVSHLMRYRESNLLLDASKMENRGILTLNFKQPLLRGAGRAVTEIDLQLQELDYAFERHRLVNELTSAATEGLTAYWQLHRALRGLSVRKISVDTLQKLGQMVARRVEGGFAPRTELLDADIALTSRQTELVRAERASLESQSRLRSMLSLAPFDHAEVSFEPQIQIQLEAPEDTHLEQRLQRPVETWPSYQMALMRQRQEQLRLNFARNQVNPDLSLEVGYNRNSLAQAGQTAFRQSFLNIYPGWSVQLGLEVPIGNDRARSRASSQALKAERADMELQAASNSIRNDVMTRWQQLQLTQREAQQLRKDVATREKLLEADRAQYELGRARFRQVLEREEDLNEARLRLLDGEIRVELARMSLSQADATLLDRYGVMAR